MLERPGTGFPYLSFVQLIKIMDIVTRITVMCAVGRNGERVWHWLILKVTPKHCPANEKNYMTLKFHVIRCYMCQQLL